MDRSTTHKMFNFRILCEIWLKTDLLQFHRFQEKNRSQQTLYLIIKKHNIQPTLIKPMETPSVVYFLLNGLHNWLPATAGVRRWYIFSPWLFSLLPEQIMSDALQSFEGTNWKQGCSSPNIRVRGTSLQVITDFTCPCHRGGSVNSRSEDSCLAIATKLAKLMKNWKCKIISTKCKINLLREQRWHQHHYMVAKHGHWVSKTS